MCFSSLPKGFVAIGQKIAPDQNTEHCLPRGRYYHLSLKQSISYDLKPTKVPKRIGDEWLAQVVTDACPNHEKDRNFYHPSKRRDFLGRNKKR